MPLIQDIKYPGIVGFESFDYTCSHGISPGTAILVTIPQLIGAIEPNGTIAFSDGLQNGGIPTCRVDRVSGHTDGSGTTWTLILEDRRWYWRTGAIFGRYNQLDNRGKLVPWTIRSPNELAILCLEAMGEVGYTITGLPNGLTSAIGQNLNRYLLLGENYPQTLSNPSVIWDGLPPAQALAQLCDRYGCRVIYNPLSDSVLIAPLGVGGPLPNGPCEVITPAVKIPATPIGVGVLGAYTRFQMRLQMEPVGLDWDDSYRPVNLLSYAPWNQGPATVQISTATYIGVGNPQFFMTITINVGTPNEQSFPFGSTSSPVSVPLSLGYIVNAINGTAALQPIVTASLSGGAIITLTGLQPGVSFGVSVSMINEGSAIIGKFTAALVQMAMGNGPGQIAWGQTAKFNFQNVRATAQLSLSQARNLAQQTVYRCYRVKFVDQFTQKAPITVPGYGPLVRRQQLIIQPTQVLQVTPDPRIVGGVNKGPLPNPIGGILPEFYNGYSRDRKSIAVGSIAWQVGNVLWNGQNIRANAANVNTPQDYRIFVDFTTDPVEQVITFSDYVYRWVGVGGASSSVIDFPSIILECAVLVQDPNTSAILRYTQTLPLPGTAPIEWVHEDTVQPSIVGTYSTQFGVGKPTGFLNFDLGDAQARANVALATAALKYQITAGLTNQYVGIFDISLDGAIQQVTWSMGARGPTTVASLNTEHQQTTWDYPTRRRLENLPANKSAAAANIAEGMNAGVVLPKIAGAIRNIFSGGT
jgi:hypothetical protein